MENLIICVGMFYVLHLFLTMSFSLHKVPFINWTYTGGDISGMTELSTRLASASDNLRQSLPLFLTFAVLSVICLLYTSPSPRDKRQSRMPSSA